MPRLVYTDGFFVCLCSFSEREIPARAGFRWNGERKLWFTQTLRAATQLREYADESARKEINRMSLSYTPWRGSLPYPKGQTPYPFQEDPSATYALSRNRSYLALAPGLGKTPIAAMIANVLKSPMVYICPPFLTRNVAAEFEAWSTWKPRIVRYDTKEAPIYEPDLLIVPDSVLGRKDVREEITEVADWARIVGREPFLVVDEAHRNKTAGALRTKALFGDDDFEAPMKGIVEEFERQVYLSGSHMPNGKPMELYPLLSKVAPEVIDHMTMHEFGLKYCNAYHDGYGWIYNGDPKEADVARLNERMKPFMLRLDKSVLKDLPPKTEEMVIIGESPAKLLKLEKNLLAKYSPADLMGDRIGSPHVATYLRELGLIKVRPALDFIRSILDDSGESIIVFAHHKEVIENLTAGLSKFKPFVITGETPMKDRHDSVRWFQSDPARKLFIGNYLAMGVGLTLTKATRVIFVEFSWVPGENDQASDRAHRIGQEFPVFVQYLVYENSIDRKKLEANFRKQRIIKLD